MKLSVLGYGVFALVCLCFSGYRHFPGQALSAYIHQEMLTYGVTLDIEAITPAFPPGIQADFIGVNYAESAVAQLEEFKAGVDLVSLFQERVCYPFQFKLNKGSVSGSATFPGSKGGPTRVESQFQELVLESMDLGRDLYDLSLSGIATGNMDATLQARGETTGQARQITSSGHIRISEAVFDLTARNFWVDQVSFSLAEVTFTMPDPATLKIETCRMKGKQLDLEVSGMIRPAPLLENYGLDLQVSIQLYPLFFMEAGDSLPAGLTGKNTNASKFELTIGGTLHQPKINILQEKK